MSKHEETDKKYRWLLEQRAQRFLKLVTLNAPVPIILGEYALISQALALVHPTALATYKARQEHNRLLTESGACLACEVQSEKNAFNFTLQGLLCPECEVKHAIDNLKTTEEHDAYVKGLELEEDEDCEEDEEDIEP